MPTPLERELREKLLQTDEEFRALSQKHHELDLRLNELGTRAHLAEGELVEEVTLKKRKLQLKDRMEDILRRQLSQGATTTAISASA
jgi:uncharacterized protein YdcH (DUF465 family)